MDDYAKHLLEVGRASNAFIKNSDAKNRFLYPFLPTIIVDGFYENPDLVREYALEQEYFKGNRGSWPGLRSELLHNLNPDLFQLTMKKLLFVLKDYGIRDLHGVQTGFQIIDGTWGEGWVHDDDPKLHVAGLIYLNKDAPIGSGTTLYKDRDDFNGEVYSEIFMNDVFSETGEDRAQYAKYRKEQRAQFVPTMTIENVYNRCIIFDTRTWHSADNFFGDTKENSRLTQVFFCRTVA